jgi:L-fuculose-phosphate aldolase
MPDLRLALIATAQAMQPAGLNRGTSGNVSVRSGEGFLITPTGMPYASLHPDDIPLMALDGTHQGSRKPSSEWRFRCADYAIFGSNELSTVALAAMEQRKGCLLANHGLLVAGRDLDEAMSLAVELEELCEQYWRARQLGQPVLLSAEEMSAVLEKFSGYGQQ